MRSTLVFLLLFFVIGAGSAQQKSLDYFVEKAKENSPVNFRNRNEKQITGLDLEQIKAVLTKPEVTLEANVLLAPIISHENHSVRFRLAAKDAGSYNGYDLSASDGGQYQAILNVRQPLFTKSQYRAYANKADVSGKISDNEMALSDHELEQVVAHQYLVCLRSKQQAEISSSLLKELQEQLLGMRTLVEQGLNKRSDLMLLEIESENYKLEHDAYRAEYKENLLDLNIICGIEDTTTVDVTDVNIELKNLPVSASGFLNSFVLDSMDIMAAQALTDLKYKPTVNLFANSGLNATYLPTLNRFGGSFGIALSWSLFDGNQQSFERQKTTLSLRSLRKDKQRFLFEKQTYPMKLRDQIHSLDQRLSTIENQLREYDQLKKVYLSQLPQGDVSYIDYKNIYKDIASKKQEYLALKMERQALILSCNYWNY